MHVCACSITHVGRERGMRSIGMTQFKLKSQLQEWLDLSTQKGIPIFLLIMSRAFMLSSAGSASAGAGGGPAVTSDKASDPEQVLKSSMSFLDSDTINEVVLNAAKGEVDSNDLRRRRLESIQFQKEVCLPLSSCLKITFYDANNISVLSR